jgi:hypothetical protein
MVKPVSYDLVYSLADLKVLPVEVWLLRGEEV